MNLFCGHQGVVRLLLWEPRASAASVAAADREWFEWLNYQRTAATYL